MPSAGHVDMCAVKIIGEHKVSVVSVARLVVNGIEAAALLAQIDQREFVYMQAAVGVVADVH